MTTTEISSGRIGFVSSKYVTDSKELALQKKEYQRETKSEWRSNEKDKEKVSMRTRHTFESSWPKC